MCRTRQLNLCRQCIRDIMATQLDIMSHVVSDVVSSNLSHTEPYTISYERSDIMSGTLLVAETADCAALFKPIRKVGIHLAVDRLEVVHSGRIAHQS